MEFVEQFFGEGSTLVYAWFAAMHTRVDVVLWRDSTPGQLPLIINVIEQEVKRVEAFANRFDPHSELSHINRMAYQQEVTVSEELFQILTECLYYTPLTAGYFDITINSANGFTQGIRNITTDAEKRSLRFLHPDVQLDLSGFIKGYVLRAIRRLLEKEGITNALINMGNSSIMALGNHPHGIGWKINEHLLFNECLTTSGNNTDSPWPVLNPHSRDVLQRNNPVSVRTSDPAVGEVLSTALYLSVGSGTQMNLNANLLVS